ncbi:putative bifunctional diguanylate cyclase/phosphodiesterase [Sphingomonas profundi]|uniref:putative bifunctional diguanylate cyclase/phosphodiesterase n=1 Tax=Alterirhizorhabdus profundi TaxID=2681549 RepID=UPI0018D0B78E|nr:EAL domain-containing protein [Sphingomonas profundi]
MHRGRPGLNEIGSPAHPSFAAGATVPMDAIAQMIISARQDYLNALPIAAAIVVDLEGAPMIVAANEQYDLLDSAAVTPPRGARPDAVADLRPLIEREPLRSSVRAFLLTDHAATQFDWHDGGPIGGHHFVVRLARLTTSADQERRCILSLVDRTAEVENARSLRAGMLHDSLTGLPNRVAFNEAVEQAIAEADGTPRIAVLVIDLTRFSRINESMGSLAGDELIITVARRLLRTLRGGDVLARTGGDEFAILFRLSDSGGDDALVAAGRLQATMAAPFRLSDLEIRIDCAVGCALVNELVADAEDLIRNAQLALKRAKQSGRIEIYRHGEVSAARRRLSLETELRRAIENGDLSLAFQPLIDLGSGRVSSFEALARWEHPTRGAISPVEFIPVAEESGLIIPLGRWALDAAVRTLTDWDDATATSLNAHVAVNVSAIQLARDDVVAAVKAVLARPGIGGERLTLELTESAIIGDPENATRTLQGLKDLAATIAMDDFGTGYSSLAYLQKLPIDMLKIDRSFVSGMLADRDSVAIVRAVLSLADALGMATTAEGVETAELAQTLAALGCTMGQGYYFARPLSADAALAYWLSRNS